MHVHNYIGVVMITSGAQLFKAETWQKTSLVWFYNSMAYHMAGNFRVVLIFVIFVIDSLLYLGNFTVRYNI